MDAMFPSRDHKGGPDGSIGDERHQNQKSEHNPDENGVVRAIDITHDPAHGVDARRIAEQLVASRDDRILYIISNRQIVRSYPRTGTTPWQWSAYTGDNPHSAHFHVSVVDIPAFYNDVRPWKIDPVKIENSSDPNKFTNIKTTVFQDASDAYAPFNVMPDLGYALPGRIEGELPLKITNRANGLSVIVNKADIGPWYDGRDGWPEDRWWERNARPRAEVDSRTNGAGIDITVAAARAIGIEVVMRGNVVAAGEAQLDIEIIGSGPTREKPMATDIDQINAAIKRINDAVLGLAQQITAITNIVSQVVAQAGKEPQAPIIIQPKPAAVPPEQVPMLEKPGVATSIAGFGASLLAMIAGKVGTPLGLGEFPSDIGTGLLTAFGSSAAFGMAGGWRGLIKTVAPAILRGALSAFGIGAGK
jgi:hypothetical protein